MNTRDFNITGRSEWHDWLARIAGLSRASRAQLVDRALADLAQREGWPAPPPRLEAYNKDLDHE